MNKFNWTSHMFGKTKNLCYKYEQFLKRLLIILCCYSVVYYAGKKFNINDYFKFYRIFRVFLKKCREEIYNKR